MATHHGCIFYLLFLISSLYDIIFALLGSALLSTWGPHSSQYTAIVQISMQRRHSYLGPAPGALQSPRQLFCIEVVKWRIIDRDLFSRMRITRKKVGGGVRTVDLPITEPMRWPPDHGDLPSLGKLFDWEKIIKKIW